MPERTLTIWVFNHYAIPPSEAGGSRHFALARNLIARGHRVFIVASCRNYQAPEHSRLSTGESSRLEVIDGVPFLWLKTSAYRTNGISRISNMISYARGVLSSEGLACLPRPDVVIGSSPHPFAALAAAHVASRLHAPFLLEVRDLWPQSLIDVAGVSRFNPFVVLLGWIERFLYRRANAVISLLPQAGDYIRAVSGKPVEIIRVPNGVDLSSVPPPSAQPETEDFTLMYAGAHGPANGLDVVLDAAAILEREGRANNLRIRLIGEGAEKRRLQDRAAERGLTSVSFEDPIPKADIYSRLAQANGFLMLLKDSPVFRWGISPNKLFDYMASGRPVIFGVSTPHNPVALARAGITIPPGDPGALAEAIVLLRSLSLAERREMGLRGRGYVEENHGFDRLSTRIETACLTALREVSAPDAAHRRRAQRLKRLFDLCVGTILLVLATPLMLLVALVIRLTMGSPVLFRQTRAGLKGRPFAILKFRTMRRAESASWDPSSDGGRITSLGRFLRRWSLDELPQLFNVLRGEMSLVGPRPLPLDYVPRYTTRQERRLDALPGVTGWAQVNGRNAVDWQQRFELDTWYVNNRSLGLDLRILAKTITQVVARRGISAPGAATMTEFVGAKEEKAREQLEARDVVA